MLGVIARIRAALSGLGPGLITGAADVDPSTTGTCAVVGASLGFQMLWTPLLLFPLMAALQLICAKIGLVTGMGLAGVLRRHYPRPILAAAVSALVVANMVNAGADIGAIAAGISLLVPVPVIVLIAPVGLAILALQVWASYRLIERVFKWLALSLLAYVATVFLVRPDARQVLGATFVPSVAANPEYVVSLLALLGTAISPYLFFWQSNQEVEEEAERGCPAPDEPACETGSVLRVRRWDVNIGMLFSNLVMYCVILTAAATLFRAGHPNVESAADLARTLTPLAGRAAGLLTALALIGSGFLAVPVLTGSIAYAVSEMFGWPWGMNERPGSARQFYGAIAVATLVAIVLNYAGVNPVRALFLTSVVNGLAAPGLMVLVLLIANDRGIVGDEVNGLTGNLLGVAATIIMFAAAVALIVTWIR